MIDIHSHILPGIDDGAGSFTDAALLARQAVEIGIHTVVATPHHANGRYLNWGSDILGAVDCLNADLERAQIPLTILPGQEVRLYPDLIDDLKDDKIITLAESRYLLLEFPPTHVPEEALYVCRTLMENNIVPILAHPERNAQFAEEPSKLYRFVEEGAYCQVTCHAFTGQFGATLQKRAFEWLAHHWVHVISSDAHHPIWRPFALSEAYEAISHSTSTDMAAMLQRNAEAIVEDRSIERLKPIRQKNRFLHWL